jgi:hypothetical protein
VAARRPGWIRAWKAAITDEPSRSGRRPGLLLRRVAVLAGPLLVYVAVLIHPTGLQVGRSDRLFLAVHLAFPVLICLLAWSLILLVNGVDNRAATAVRVLAIPFAVAYTAFATFDGIAIGTFVWKANDLPANQRLEAARLIHRVSNSELEWPLYLIAGGFWLATAFAVVIALRHRAPLPALVLLALGALLFAKSHVRPWGPAGMTAFLAGAVWVELHASSLSTRVRGASVPVATRRRT